MHPDVQAEKMLVNQDDSGAIHVATKPVGSARSKQIDTCHDFIQDSLLHADMLNESLKSETSETRQIHNELDYGLMDILLGN